MLVNYRLKKKRNSDVFHFMGQGQQTGLKRLNLVPARSYMVYLI